MSDNIRAIPSPEAAISLRVRMVEVTCNYLEQRQRWARQLQALWGQLLERLPELGVCNETYQVYKSCCELEYQLTGDCLVCHELESVFEDFMLQRSDTVRPECR